MNPRRRVQVGIFVFGVVVIYGPPQSVWAAFLLGIALGIASELICDGIVP